MRWIGNLAGLAFAGLLAAAAVWALHLDDAIRASIAAGHLLDWVTGGLCVLWLLIILKAPWDLYFQASGVVFEIQRSRERGILPPSGREEYLVRLRRRLGWAAVGAHLGSAALVASVALFTGGKVGYWFAVFYLVSTAFRPVAAGYVYLVRKLREILREVKYPREDVVELRERVRVLEEEAKASEKRLDDQRTALEAESVARQNEYREIRQRVHAIGREFETTVSRLTDNQEVIRGIQAFVRLVAQSAS